MFIVMINPVLEPMGPFTPSLFRFSWHEVTRVLLLPPAPSPPPWDASPSQGSPSIISSGFPDNLQVLI